MKKHIDKDDEENWNIEIDDINENINFKFVKKSFGQITNTYKTIPDFISYNQAKKRRIQKIQNSINDVRNSIPQRKTAVSFYFFTVTKLQLQQFMSYYNQYIVRLSLFFF